MIVYTATLWIEFDDEPDDDLDLELVRRAVQRAIENAFPIQGRVLVVDAKVLTEEEAEAYR